MGRIWMPGGGGGGADLDVITAASGDVLKGAVIVGPDGEPLTGTLELTGNAADSQVLLGKTYYNTDAKAKRTGVMVNCGAVSPGGLNAGGSYTIPEGYHNGAGKVQANSLASQTDGTAVAGHILSGKTAWVKGSKITGTMAVQSILSFSAAPYGVKQVIFTWKNPAKGPFSGVIIVYKTGSYPSSITDGTRIYKGSGSNSAANGSSSVTCTMPAENTTYYFRAFSYATQNNGEWVHSTTYTASATTARSSYTFTSSGSFTAPAGSTITAFLVGGGGGGACAYECNGGSGVYNGGGGGGGGYTKITSFSVSSATTVYVTVGSGGGGLSRNLGKGAGSKTTPSRYQADDGGASSIKYGSTIVTASGGQGGSTYSNNANTNCIGGNGGSGGGSGGYTTGTRSYDGWHGGSNGENPSANTYSRDMTQATGQGATTRAFGESSGTLYAGGGGGGAAGHWNCNNPKTKYPGNPGSGGSGGGGSAGGTGNMDGGAGGANTGGGGGGGRSDPDLAANISGQWSGAGGNGGSGIVLIRIQ